MSFPEFANTSWEATRSTIVLTGNKSIKQFFQTKSIPPVLWNAYDYTLNFNFKIAHIAGTINTAADFLSVLKLELTEKTHLKVREDLQTTPVGVTTPSSDVADEKKFFFAQANNESESEEQTLRRREQSRQDAREWDPETENSRQTPCFSATDSRQKVQALQNNRGWHNPQRRPLVSETLRRNW